MMEALSLGNTLRYNISLFHPCYIRLDWLECVDQGHIEDFELAGAADDSQVEKKRKADDGDETPKKMKR